MRLGLIVGALVLATSLVTGAAAYLLNKFNRP
jgi:hypothetical protein